MDEDCQSTQAMGCAHKAFDPTSDPSTLAFADEAKDELKDHPEALALTFDISSSNAHLPSEAILHSLRSNIISFMSASIHYLLCR